MFFTQPNCSSKVCPIYFFLGYNLGFPKMTLYGISRYTSTGRSKEISGETILSGPQDAKLNRILEKNCRFAL